jgi:hypothetical protein
VRRELAANSPMAIIQRHSSRSEVSRGVYQGDTERNRLDAIQQVPDQGNPP